MLNKDVWAPDPEKIKEKRLLFRNLPKSQDVSAYERYKLASKEAKKAIKETKNKFFDDLYEKLDTRERKNEIYKIARHRERISKDINGITCIKDEKNKVLVSDVDIKLRWRNDFDKSFNGVQREQIVEPPVDEGRRILLYEEDSFS
ncbi:uncharacterized protein [Rutidosis leptorrhynchoides]|uniref:uncharacterized protein n=1 Tax=Rutidosis leptorrhynchoides TaxID=125765 RepID=UPI003A990720